MKERFKKLITLFLTFFKIGMFTFGGGYAMIPIIQHEVSVKRKWLRAEEVNEVITISETTPGPIAINAATYVGYKVGGILGSIFATIGLIIPPFFIIFIISLFYEKFLAITVINNAFKGIKAVVAFLVLNGAYNLFKTMKKNVISIILLLVCFIYIILAAFIPSISISSIFLILIGAVIGIICEFLKRKNKEENK